MRPYKRNKIKTACDIYSRIENWPTAFGLRLQPRRAGLRLLHFRDGLEIICRGGTRDWDVVHELLFAGCYDRAMTWLRNLGGRPLVLDLGGNIGLFSLLAARNHPTAEIHAFEPGPPNYQLFEMNCLANPALGKRIHLQREAVGGQTNKTEWIYDIKNPAGSGIYGKAGEKFEVSIRAFSEIINSFPGDIALAKIDIEGAEYDLLDHTPAESWKRIQAVSLEVHGDPNGKSSPAKFLEKVREFGFKIEEESVISFFLHR